MSLADQSLQFFPVSARVSVLRARGLRIKGKDGTNDAYTVLQAGRETFRTPVAEKLAEPVWGGDAAAFIFTLPAEGAPSCSVRVLHRVPLGADKLLGLTVVDVHELRQDNARENPRWFKLLNKAGKADKERGEVLLDIQFLKSSMSVSMIDLSDKSHSRLGKFKDKLKGKKKEGLSDSASAILPSVSQVLTDSEGEMDGEMEGESTKKKKNKLKSLFVPKSNMKRNSLSQSMSSLRTLPDRNSSISSSTSSGLNVESSEGKKKKKFSFLTHKRNGSTDSKASNQSDFTFGSANQNPPPQVDMCINGSHIYREQTQSEEVREMEEEEEEEEGENEEEEESWRRQEEERRREAEEERKRKEKEEQLRKEEEEKERIRREREKEEQRKRKEEEEKERIRMEREKEEQRKRKEEEEKERIRMEREKEEQRKRKEEEEKERMRMEREKEEQKRMEEEEKERRRMEREREEQRRKMAEEKEMTRMEEEEKERIRMEREKQEQRRRVEEEERERQRIEKEEQRRKLELEESMRMKREKEEQMRKLEEERKRKEEMEAEELRRKLAEDNDRKKAEEEEKMRIAEEERKKEEKKRAERERMIAEEEKTREEKRIEMERRLADEKKAREEEERRIAEEKEKQRKEEERVREEKERKRKEEEQERRNTEMEGRKKKEKQMREEQERLKMEEIVFEESVISQSTDFTRSARISNVKPSVSSSATVSQASMANTNPFLDNDLDASIFSSVEEKTAKKGRAPSPPQGPDFTFRGVPKQLSHLKEVSKLQAPQPPDILTMTREAIVKENLDQAGLDQGERKESKGLSVSQDEPVPVKHKRPAPKPRSGISVSDDKPTSVGEILTEGTVHLEEPGSASSSRDNQLNLKLLSALTDITGENVESDLTDELSRREEHREDIIEPKSAKPNSPSWANQDLFAEPLVCRTDELPSMERPQKKSRAPLPPNKPRRTGDSSTPHQQPSLPNKTNSEQAQETTSVYSMESAANNIPSLFTVSSSAFTPYKSQVVESVETGSGSRILPWGKLVPNDAGEVREQVDSASVFRQHAVKPLSAAEKQSETHESRLTDNTQPKTKAAETVMKGPYSQLTQTELISLALRQQEQISQRDARIQELEQYIDNLLVRVMEEKPSILMSLNTKNKSM
ncbi:hypothetical protein QTP86_021084 [Hemibagrus guttatus]|nr:hypothetical protein QTP86_021084 [Hemibagrus guttatus]